MASAQQTHITFGLARSKCLNTRHHKIYWEVGYTSAPLWSTHVASLPWAINSAMFYPYSRHISANNKWVINNQVLEENGLIELCNGFLFCRMMFSDWQVSSIGLTFIVNGTPRPGVSGLATEELWELNSCSRELKLFELMCSTYSKFILDICSTRLSWKIENKATGQEQEAYLIDECVVNAEGKMILINRVGPKEFYKNHDKWLSS